MFCHPEATTSSEGTPRFRATSRAGVSADRAACDKRPKKQPKNRAVTAHETPQDREESGKPASPRGVALCVLFYPPGSLC